MRSPKHKHQTAPHTRTRNSPPWARHTKAIVQQAHTCACKPKTSILQLSLESLEVELAYEYALQHGQLLSTFHVWE